MAGKVKTEGYRSGTPYLLINGAAKAIDFYKRVFGATELMRFDAPGGKPFGHLWSVATHIEDVSVEEMKHRMGAMAPRTRRQWLRHQSSPNLNAPRVQDGPCPQG